MTLSTFHKAFREDVRAFLEEHLDQDLRRASRLTPTVFVEPDIGFRWQKILYEKGWLGYNWPDAYGGIGWDPIQRYVFERECALAHAPELPVLSLKLLGPVLHEFGSEDQKEYYLPRILSGEHYWCQGFSEPGAGSDLANLATRAVRQGSDWIVNGSKLWTTHAQHADRMFCLVRTNNESTPQSGISFLLIDMKQPGVEIRPIISIAGDHEVNAVFLNDVVVPAADMIGEEGQGWSIAKFLLENERAGSCHAPALLTALSDLREEAKTTPAGNGMMMIDDQSVQSCLARLEFQAQALEFTELRILTDVAKGRKPGPQTSVIKLVASNLRQDISRLAVRVYGYAGLQLPCERPFYSDDAPPPVHSEEAQVAAARYLNNRAWTIFGGSNEIQRTIIAKRVLNL